MKKIKLLIPEKEKVVLREGEKLIVRGVSGKVITLVKPEDKGIEKFRGIWENKEVEKVFAEIAKAWKSWKPPR
jgi:hypothetical protein